MIYLGQRVQVDMKAAPRKSIADSVFHLFQYTVIDKFTFPRFLAAYSEQSTYSMDVNLSTFKNDMQNR